MIRNAFILLIILFFSSCTGQNLSLMTYNIRLDVAVDGENAWVHRKEFLTSQLKFYTPDIFGTQEGLPHQINFIDSELSNYGYIGKGRDGEKEGEYSAIFYNNKKFNVKKEHTFWLSPTPNKKSKGWDAAYIRICTYGLFVDKKTNQKFWIFNTHLDNEGKIARKKGIELILKRIKKVNATKYPVILMGDFNALPESDLIEDLLKKMNDSKDISLTSPFGPEGTFNGFEFNKPITRRIDYILLSKSGEIKVEKYAVLSDSNDMKYPSDHLPVYVELRLNK